MPAILKKPVFLIPLAGIILFACSYSQIENFFVFHPQAELGRVPDQLGLGYASVDFEAEDGTRLHGWFFPLPGKGPVILFCHGNAGNISHRLRNVKKLLDWGFQVFIYDYRGYGKSQGKPSRNGIFMDGLAAYDVLTKRMNIPPERIISFGRSLGGAVAVEIATKRKVDRLILESTFTSTRDMARTMPLFAILSPFLPAHYNNLKKIERIGIPKLMIHGKEDRIVPFSMGARLFQAAAQPKQFYPIDGAGHNDTWLVGGAAYFETLKRFANPRRRTSEK